MDNNLIEIFGRIIKTSKDTGLDIIFNLKNDMIPKNPDEEQTALLRLIDSLDNEQYNQLMQGVKYCIELSLFKLVSSVENGVGGYSFDLSIQHGNDKKQLVGENVDNGLSYEYWNWVK